MNEPHFPILGPTIPPLLGRATLMRRLWTDLTKRTPSHVSIVGPRYSGKSVLMRALASRMSDADSPYKVVLSWHLGHQTPESDAAFVEEFARRLASELAVVAPAYNNYLINLNKVTFGDLKEVFEALHGEGITVLLLWDGFDRPLAYDKLSGNLWDQVRELASIPSLRLVTATRRPLHELLRSDETDSSLLWGVFDQNPVRLGVFDDHDQEAVLALLPEFSFSSGAKCEMDNWTSGYPPLFLALLNRLSGLRAGGPIDNALVNQAAEGLDEELHGVLSSLWGDCSIGAQELYRHLLGHSLASSTIGRAEALALIEKGFARESGRQLQKRCRLLERFVSAQTADVGIFVRLFSTMTEYENNIRRVLELRLEQISGIDPRMRRLLHRAIEDLPEDPDVCLSSLRGISDRALDLIWNAELGNSRTIDQQLLRTWDMRGDSYPEAWKNGFPTSRGQQIRLLQLLTGTANTGSRAKCVTKNAYTLANAIQSFADFGQHLEGAAVPLGVAVTAVFAGIELASCLAKELSSTRSTEDLVT